MKSFAAKAEATADKIRGGYYTPPAIARFLAAWVSEAGERVLEPSCGDGRILSELASLTQHAMGVELLAAEADKARFFAPVQNASLFDWWTPTEVGAWDGVAGNPPYIRFGNWPESQRTGALELMRAEGLKPSRLTNAWVPFVVASTLAVRDGGRVGLVLPAELLQVTYAGQLREYLLEKFTDLTLVTFEKLVFDGILQEVVLLCGIRGDGPAKIRTVHLSNSEDLASCSFDVPAAPTLFHEHEKWTKYFLAPGEIELLRALRTDPDLTTLGKLASVDVGIVTGRNSFFTFTDQEVERLGLIEHCVPLVSRSAQLVGTMYDDECRALDLQSKHRTWLLNAPDELDDGVLAEHVRTGEEAGVHLGYKCSIRKPWWRTPSLWVPDLFMLRQIHLAPRMTVNAAAATSTDTVHRVRILGETDPVRLATVFNNSATFAFSEVLGRSYGGGILELEPREAELLPIPSPDLVTDELAAEVDALLRSAEPEKALDLVDRQVLGEGLGWSPERIQACKDAWITLRDRRSRRGRK